MVRLVLFVILAIFVARAFWRIVDGILEADMLRDFPKRTEADLYVWLIEHLWYLREAGELDEDASLEAAARSYASRFSQRPARLIARVLRDLTKSS